MSEIEIKEAGGRLYVSAVKEIKSLKSRLENLLIDLEKGEDFTDHGFVERANEIERYLVAYQIVNKG